MWRVVVLLLVLLAGGASAEPARDVAKLASDFRVSKGLNPLAISPVLEAAAEAHARDMAKRGFFSHKGSDGSSVATRAKRKGYRYCLIAENIAKGQASAAEVMQSWIGSKGHRDNMLRRKMREIGVAHVKGDIWVMVLGTGMGGC